MKRAFIFAFFLLSCTHWLIDTETRIQVENSTGYVISDLCIVSKSGQRIIFVPDSIEIGLRSKVYEVEWVGEFDFEVRVGDDWGVPLGTHRLKGGSVLAQIKGKDGEFEMVLK
ncbi:hypothetical protein R83H12_01830 [Fibrobacteria bacterium R8-3-H12]